MSGQSSTRWPAGARSACLITVTFEAELGVLSVDPTAADREKTLSVGRYGATRGVERLLAVLAAHDAAASWFVPADNALRYSTLTGEVLAAGHEIANCGRALENFSALDLSQQLRAVGEAQRLIEDRHGVRTTGFRPGRGDPDPGLAALLHADGYRWSSQLRGDDLPVLHPSGLVELPHHHELDDAAYFAFNLDPPLPAGSPRIAPIGDVFANWSIELQAHREEGLLFVLDLHPEIIGTPARSAMLSDLLGQLADSDVWIAPGRDVAAWWIQQQTPAGPLPDDHPLTVFDRHTAATRTEQA